jgi:cytochrome c peroxidase
VLVAAIALVAMLAAGAGGVVAPRGQSSGVDSVGASGSEIAALGRKIFFDSSLSASGRLACASCHSPEHAYGPPNGLAVQLGGEKLDRQGMRAVPSLGYVLNRTPVWYKEYVSNIAERIREGEEPPAGGFGADGRFSNLRNQAAFPLLSPNEMANASRGAVVSALRRGTYAVEFSRVFGSRVLDDTTRAFARALYAIEQFELRDSSFHPYDSKFDAVLDGRASLTPTEKRGLALFSDPAAGNCASCHVATIGADGSHPLFTDYQFEALGVPRNPEITANRDSAYVDEGLCGPTRTDQRDHDEYCGMFKTPTLRNVATRRAFFHNGRFHSLEDALRFYVRRDTDAEHWYSRARNGRTVKFDDLPPAHRANVDTVDLPLTRHAGERPVWSDVDIRDVIAFLETLNDGYGRGAALVATKSRPGAQ